MSKRFSVILVKLKVYLLSSCQVDVKKGLMSLQTHYRSYQGQITQITWWD